MSGFLDSFLRRMLRSLLAIFFEQISFSSNPVTAPTTTQLRKTALHSAHRRLGAKMVDFGGWDMPVEYSGIVSEHLATRTAAGLFDVSHMGEIEVRGPHALDLVQHVTSNNAAKLRRRPGAIFRPADLGRHIRRRPAGAPHFATAITCCASTPATRTRISTTFASTTVLAPAELENAGPRYSQLAIQGPKALGILERFTRAPIAALKYYHFMFGEVDGVACLIARTGYTGEDGFELYFSPEHSEKLWNDLAGSRARPRACCPAAWARGTRCAWKRRMCLYGHEIDDTTTVWEAKLGWICKLDKGDFLGRDALLAQRQSGVRRMLVGFEMQDRLIARDG